MSAAVDVVVVGAGAVGAACARELAERGASVVVVDRGEAWATGCSAGNTGLIVPSHARPLANPAMLRDGLGSLLRRDARFGLELKPRMWPWSTRYALASLRNRSTSRSDLLRELATESLELWRAWAPRHLKRSGLLDVYTSQAGFLAASAALAAVGTDGVRYERLDAAAAIELEPTLPGHIAGAVYFPDEHYGDPTELVGAAGRAAEALGAQLRTGTTAIGLRRGGGVTTDRGEVVAGRVVLAAGSASGTLGIRLPLAAGRGCSVDVVQGVVHPRLPVVLEESHVVASPFEGRTRVAGTFDIAAAKSSAPAQRRRVDAMLEGARSLLKTTGEWRTRPVWTGSASLAPDGMPIVGAVPSRPDVLVATGHAMLGVTLGPVTGRLIADAVDGTPPPTMLAPGRFRSRANRPAPTLVEA